MIRIRFREKMTDLLFHSLCFPNGSPLSVQRSELQAALGPQPEVLQRSKRENDGPLVLLS